MLSIPEALWAEMLDRFAESPCGVERVAYLDGIRWTDASGRTHGAVTTVVLPDALLTPGNYRVPAEAMARAGRHMIDLGLTRLAQVHTHGNGWTDHSLVDDRMAYTRREGGLSIVLPFHARRRPVPAEGGVHVREESGWRRVGRGEADGLLRLVPSTMDFRASAARKRRMWWFPWNR